MKLSVRWKKIILTCAFFFVTWAAFILPPAAEAAGTLPTAGQAVGQQGMVKPAIPAAEKAGARTAGTILFVPLDDRPVCMNYSADTVRAAGWDVQLPPDTILASAAHNGNPDQVYAWLKAKAPEAVAIVASSDTLIYGGLVPSRTHHFTAAELEKRVQRLLNLKKTTKVQNVYTFTISIFGCSFKKSKNPLIFRSYSKVSLPISSLDITAILATPPVASCISFAASFPKV